MMKRGKIIRILFMLPARSGSKGLPNKNIINLCGKPLMYYAIDAIKSSQSYSAHECVIIINTDSEQYAEIAKRLGIEAPFIRPLELSDDNSKIKDVIEHTFRFYGALGTHFELFALVQITSPLITSDDVDRAIEAIISCEGKFDSVCAVAECEVMPLWCNTLPMDLSLNNFIPDDISTKNRQELPKYYKLTGSIRVAFWNKFIENDYNFIMNAKAVVLPSENSIDIDTDYDFEICEYLLKKRYRNIC